MSLFNDRPVKFRTQEEEARHYGYCGPWEDFLKLLLDLHDELYPGVSVDDLVDNSPEAMAFTGVVRYKTGCLQLPAFFVNRVLHRQRKKGREQLREEGLA